MLISPQVEASLSTAQASAAVGAYSHVEDLAGRYVAERSRLRALKQRRQELLG